MGWAEEIDHDRIMDGVPPDTVLTIDATTAGAEFGSRRVGSHRSTVLLAHSPPGVPTGGAL